MKQAITSGMYHIYIHMYSMGYHGLSWAIRAIRAIRVIRVIKNGNVKIHIISDSRLQISHYTYTYIYIYILTDSLYIIVMAYVILI